MKTALLAGGTGLIGSQVLQLLLANDRYDKVIAVTRKPLPEHAKLVELDINPSGFVKLDATQSVDDVFCCLGTTMANARSKEKFKQVDFTYPMLLAKEGLARGAKQYLLVSALGADKNASIFYNQVKGELEEAISNLGFETVHIFRPSLLLGPRKEKRSAEDAAKFFYKLFGFLIPGKYKAIESVKVARAMLHYASQSQKVNFIHESLSLQNF
jgi:uncharacterized protein YbjT (DUF2867 family)